jgi:hypothetical protein
MDDLVRVLLISLCCLACTEECEEGILQVNGHQLRDSQAAAAERELALVRLGAMLDAMACEMHKVGCLQRRNQLGWRDVLLGSLRRHVRYRSSLPYTSHLLRYEAERGQGPIM